MVTKTKKQAQPAKKTNFVMVTPELQDSNELVKKAFNAIISQATELLKKFEMTKYRTYAYMDYNNDEHDRNNLVDFVCHFWSLSLSRSNDGKFYIWLRYDSSFIEKFGHNLTNQLLRGAYKATEEVAYSFKVAFQDHDVHNYFYKLIVGGETDTVSIFTVDKVEK